MMKKILLLNMLWLLVAVAAYQWGRREAPRPPLKETVVAVPAPAPLRLIDEERGRGVVRAVEAGDDAGAWVASFRSADGTISPERMAEAVQAALRESDPVRSMMYFTQLVGQLTAENAPLALQAVRENTSGWESMRYMNLITHAWGEKAGAEALVALKELRGREGAWARSSALAGWAAADPLAAQRWLADGNLPEERREAMAMQRGLLHGLARVDVDQALGYLMTLPQDQRDDFVDILAEQKLKEGPQAASQWALTLADPEMKTDALGTISRQYLRLGLDQALQWAAGLAGDDTGRRAVGRIADEFAERNPGEAFAWAEKLPAGRSRVEAYEEVFHEWTRSDPFMASTQLTQLRPGPERDAAITAFSRTFSRENPQDALVWAGVITDPQERMDTTLDIVRNWNARAPAEAQQWIAANLPPELQVRALQRRNR